MVTLTLNGVQKRGSEKYKIKLIMFSVAVINARFNFLIFTNFETMTCKYAHLWKHRNSRNTCKEYKFLYIVVINSDLSYLYIIRPQTFLVNQAKSVVLTFY